jgi:hypothetical protein
MFMKLIRIKIELSIHTKICESNFSSPVSIGGLDMIKTPMKAKTVLIAGTTAHGSPMKKYARIVTNIEVLDVMTMESPTWR